MSLKVAGSMVSVEGNATAGTITYQSLSNADASQPDIAILRRQVLFKLDGDGDFKISQLDIVEVGDVLNGLSYMLAQILGVMLIRKNTELPPSFELDRMAWAGMENLPIGFQSQQAMLEGTPMLLQTCAGDNGCKGGNIPQHRKVDLILSRRGQQLRLTISYLGEGENLPESQIIDAGLPAGYDPHILMASGILPQGVATYNVPFSVDYTFVANSTPLVDFNGFKDGIYLNGLVINNGEFEVSPCMQKLSGPQWDIQTSTYGNVLLNDGDRIRYRVNNSQSNCIFTFGLRASDYVGTGNMTHNPLWDGPQWMHRRVFDTLSYRAVNGVISRDDPQWTMTYNSGPDVRTQSISPATELTDINNVEFVVCRIGDQYIRYLQEIEGDRLDFKRFNQLPDKSDYQVMSFITIDTLPAYSTSTLQYDPDLGFDVSYVKEVISSEERAELLNQSSSLMHDEKINISTNYNSKIVDERGSISYKPEMNGQVTADFPINLGLGGFFELEFDPTDRNKSYHLQLTHDQPDNVFDYILVSIHSPDGVQPHQLRVATYSGSDVTFEQNYGTAAWNSSLTRAGVMLNLLAQDSGIAFIDVSRHTPSPDGHVPLNNPFAVYVCRRDMSASLRLTVASHADTEPGSWLCNYNKSDFKLKKTWLGYMGERLYMGSDVHHNRHLDSTFNSPVQQGGVFTGTINWKILPETSTPWHREEPPEGGIVDNDSQTATGFTNFGVTASSELNNETEAPFATHADARFYIVNNPILANYMDSFGTNTTYWRANATVIRNVNNVIYLDEYDYCAEIINRTTLATITGDDQLENYRFNWKTMTVNGSNVMVCRLMCNGQVIWTSPQYPVITASEIWGKYIAVFYEVHAGFDMSNGYTLPDTQYKILTGA